MPDYTILPEEFWRFRKEQAVHLNQWQFIDENQIETALVWLRQEYPWHKDVFPFAEAPSMEDIAVFARENDSVVVKVIHSGSSRGFEVDVTYPSFGAWFAHVTKT